MNDQCEHAGELAALHAALAHAEADTRRLDWLADPSNRIGSVMLPRAVVGENVHDLRAAIDAAMALSADG